MTKYLSIWNFMIKENYWGRILNITRQYILSTLFIGVFLFLFFGLNVEQTNAASLPVVDTSASTKLLEKNGVYYYAFTSSTVDGKYHMFVATSTNGVSNNWSSPIDVFNYGIFTSGGLDSSNPIRTFGFDYNTIGGYFGAAIYATGTSEIWFVTSTDGGHWSATSTAASGVSAFDISRRLFLDFSDSENLAAIFYQDNSGGPDLFKVVTSTNGGQTWSAGNSLSAGNNASQILAGGKVSGSGSSRVFQLGYFDNNNYRALYASSTNGGTWTTTTVATGLYVYLAAMSANIGFNSLISFNVDSDGLPSIVYYQPLAVGAGGPPFDVTSTIVYAHKSNAGSWSTSTILSNVHFQLTNSSEQRPADLYFFNGNRPIFTGLGSSFGYVALINTSSAWNSYSLDAGTLADRSSVSSVYSTSSQIWSTSYILSDGSLKFSTTSLPTAASAVSAIHPVEIYGPYVTVTTTVSDTDGSKTNLYVEISSDGLSWSQGVIANVSAGFGSVTTSTGNIFGLDMSTASNTVTFNLDVGGGPDYAGSAYVRITPSDVLYTGTPVTSGAFALDIARPTTIGNLSLNSAAGSSIILNLPTTTSTDGNFSQYKIFYSTSSPVTESATAFTSSSDPNLANSGFNGATTTTITGLSAGTTYYFKIYAYDSYGNSTSSASELTAATAYAGHLPTVSADSKTKLLLINSTYYLAFSSSTSDGSYHLYIVTSTSGLDGTWSQPKDVFNYGIFRDNNSNTTLNGFFGFDYNTVGGYFGAAIYATGTSEIWFATSTNGNSWSATSTAVSSLGVSNSIRNLHLIFSNSENLATIFYNSTNNADIKMTYSTNGGVSWTQSSAISLGAASSLLGGRISGSGLSRVFHFGYFNESSFSVIYASSTDNGTTWVTSTVATNVKGNIPNPGPGDFGFSRIGVFNLDGNNQPAFIYYQPVASGGGGPYDVTSTLVYAHRNNSGVWTTSSLASVYWSIDSSAQLPSDLIFANTDKPIFASLGTGPSLIGGYNNGSSWTTSTITASVLSQYGDVSLVANTSSNIWVIVYPLNNGTLNFTTSSLNLSSPNPTAPTSLSFDQVTTSSVRLNWVSGNGGETEFVVMMSSNGVNFTNVSSTPTTTLNLTINNTNFPALSTITPNTRYYFEVVASSTTGQATSSVASTYTSSTVPVSLVASSVSTSSLTLSWGANSNASTTVYQISGDNSFATTTAATTTKDLTSLTPNTAYTFTVRAQNASDTNTYSASVSLATSTLATIPGTPSASVTSSSRIDLVWSANSNPGTTVYEVYNVTDVASVATTTATSYSVTGLTANTTYQFKIRAFNVGGGYSNFSSNSTATTTWTTPTVATVDASAISTSSVTFNGNITSIGVTAVTVRGFIYGTSTAYGATSSVVGSFSTGTFTATINSLDSATPYHYKAFATNAVNTTYGADSTFITVSAPTVGAPTTTITSLNTATTTILVSSTVTNAVVDISSLTAANSSTLPGAMSVSLDTDLGAVQLTMASGTLITADASWNGTLVLPSVQSNSSVSGVADSGYTATVAGVVEIGYGDVALTLSKAARILIPGMSGKLVGYYRDGAFTKISSTCSDDTQTTGDALSAGADCKINSGSDLVVWTKHFTKFATYSQTQNSTGGTGGGGGSIPVYAPSSPTVAAPSMLNQTFSVTGSTEVKVGNVAHKVQLNKIDLVNNQATFTIESTPIIFTLKLNEEKVLDTNGDKENDIRVKLSSINAENKTVNLIIVSIADLQFTINHFDLTTTNRDVTLYFNSPEAKQMAISESDTFKGAVFESYQKTKKWKLSAGAGVKKVYVKFRTSQGGVKVISSEIMLLDSGVLSVPDKKTTSVAESVPVVSEVSTGFIFKKNLSVGSVSSDVQQLQLILKKFGYFTYPKITNTFGSYTREAVKKFQKAKKIKPINGMVGPLTRKALNNL